MAKLASSKYAIVTNASPGEVQVPAVRALRSSDILQVGSSDGVRRRSNGLTDLEAFELRMIDVE